MKIPSIRSVRSEWGLGVEVVPDLWRIRLQNPFGSIAVNTYLYVQDDFSFLMDPGWPWTLNRLEEALQELYQMKVEDVTHLLYTHTHPDHMGLAAVLSHRSDARSYFSSTIPQKMIDCWHSFIDDSSEWGPWEISALAKGAREEARIRRSGESSFDRTYMTSHFGALGIQNGVGMSDGEVVVIGDLDLEWQSTPGHDPHHGVFIDRAKGWLFAGDVVLPTATPFLSFLGDELQSYIDSVKKVRSMNASMILPGHGTQRAGLVEKMIDNSLSYVEKLDQAITEKLVEHTEPVGLYEIAMWTTEETPTVRGPGRWLWYLGRVEAHLRRMIDMGWVTKSDDEGPHYQWVGSNS